MRRALLVLIAAATFAALGAGSVASAPAACKPGVTRISGLSACVFCGAAKATVHYGSKVFTFTQGECAKTSQYVAVNVGAVILGQTTKPKPNYFGLLIGKSPAGGTKPASRDGIYTGGVLALDYGGKGYLVRGETLKVRLSGGRSRGTLAGASLFDNPPLNVTGSFSC